MYAKPIATPLSMDTETALCCHISAGAIGLNTGLCPFPTCVVAGVPQSVSVGGASISGGCGQG